MKTITELTIPKKEEKLIQLAPYIRVSSNSDDQLLSFAAQVSITPTTRQRIPNMCW